MQHRIHNALTTNTQLTSAGCIKQSSNRPGDSCLQPANVCTCKTVLLTKCADLQKPKLAYHGLQVVSSAIVDKYIGESARLIREMFGYAKEHQPCIIFMDEIDAIGGRRFSEGTSADREIQRTLMELLSQLDGFDVVGKVGLRFDVLLVLV